MKKLPLSVAGILLACLLPMQSHCGNSPEGFRPPAVPLAAHDPYFSIWSPADRLYDAETVHWTGKRQGLHCLVRIDGKAYRIMGSRPSACEPLPQTGLTVNPTRTIYQFANDIARLELTFTTPALPDNLDLLSRPVTYLTWRITSADGKPHRAELYFDCSAEIAVNQPDQEVRWEQSNQPGLVAIKVGTTDQAILEKQGDDLRIDWGFGWIASPADQSPLSGIAGGDRMRKTFAESGTLPAFEDPGIKKVNDGFNCMAFAWDLGALGTKPVERRALLAYDDIFSIRYFDDFLRPYWRRNGTGMESLLTRAAAEYQDVVNKCITFDRELDKDLIATGGEKYAQVAALVYRECLAAHKLTATPGGLPLLFSKENFSNGCIATVDVIYPASPFFLLFSPALTKAMLKPVLDYAASPRWKWPFAPHDLGTYPFATGQAYGGGELTEEDQMPVEESGNMLIMLAALAKAEGNADFAKPYWPVLEKWAVYLADKGFDPENQLCTDDFAGHLAHNINLSAKAIIALASYAELSRMNGKPDEYRKYRSLAETFAAKWREQAAMGDHTRLAFDQPGSWSQKYNLVWDKLLDLNLFPKEVIQREIEFYKRMQGPYGLPLDNRERWTKTDWELWTATMAEKRSDFDILFEPVYRFVNTTPQRVPVTDWYVVDNAYKVGFQARPVIGGLFIKLMSEPALQKKWFKTGADIKMGNTD